MQSSEMLPAITRIADELNWNLRRALRLAGGRINENWLLESDQGSAVFRLYPKGRKAQQIEFETGVVDHLVAAGCRVPRVLSPRDPRSPGSLPAPGASRVREVDDRLYILLEYIDAAPLSLEQANDISPTRLAHLLIPIRAALETYPAPFQPVFETRVFGRRLPQLIQQLEATHQSLLAGRVQELFDQLDAWGSRLKLPSSVIHADIHPGNVLCRGDELWLIDFDDGHVGVRALDWILPALEFSLRGNQTVDEERYQEILSALSFQRMTSPEQSAAPGLRLLLELKFAVSLADCGEPLENNPYFKLLEQRFAKTTPQRLFPELRSAP